MQLNRLWKPISTKNKTKDNQQTGMATNSQQLSCTNLKLQEDHNIQGDDIGIKDQRKVEETNKKIKENTVGKQGMPRKKKSITEMQTFQVSLL